MNVNLKLVKNTGMDENKTDNNLIAIPVEYGQLTAIGWEIPEALDETSWLEAGRSFFPKLDSARNWALGDWLRFGDRRYGKLKQLTEQPHWFGPAYETCRTLIKVCSRFELGLRRPNLSFMHHKEMAFLSEDELVWMIEYFNDCVDSKGKLPTIRATREYIKYLKSNMKNVVAIAVQPSPSVVTPRPNPQPIQTQTQTSTTTQDDGSQINSPVVHHLQYAGTQPVHVDGVQDVITLTPRSRVSGFTGFNNKERHAVLQAVQDTLSQSDVMLKEVAELMRKSLDPDKSKYGNKKLFAAFVAQLQEATKKL